MRTHAVLTRESPTTRTPGWNREVGGKGDAARHPGASPTGPPGKHGNAPVFPSTPSRSAVAAFAPAWAAPAAPLDVVFLDGKIATLDAKGSFVSAVAVKDGRFVAVGSTKAIRKLAGKPTRIVDLGGKLADMAVPSDDLFTMDPSSIDKVRALRTIVGGRVVHEARQ